MDPKTGQLALPEEQPTDEAVEPKVVKPFNARHAAMEEMARRAEERRQRDMKEEKVDVLTDTGEIVPTEPAAQIESQEAAPPPTDDTQPAPAAPTPVIEEERELIVDGRRIKVPLSKIMDAGTRTIQKETTADMRLAAATELLRTAQERTQAPPQPTAQSTQPSEEDVALARALQFGTEAESALAISRLKSLTNRPTVTQQQIEAFVTQNLSQKLTDHLAFNEANNWLKNEYSPIVSDPDLKFLFDQKEQQARNQGDRRPYKELYAAIAGDLATKFKIAATPKEPKSQPLDTTSASDRIVRKAAAPKIVQGASGRVETSTPEAKAPTMSEYIDSRRKASLGRPRI